MDPEVRLVHEDPWPYAPEQFVVGHNFAGLLDENDQNIESPAPEAHQFSALEERSLFGNQPERPEGIVLSTQHFASRTLVLEYIFSISELNMTDRYVYESLRSLIGRSTALKRNSAGQTLQTRFGRGTGSEALQ